MAEVCSGFGLDPDDICVVQTACTLMHLDAVKKCLQAINDSRLFRVRLLMNLHSISI